jgi:hypothetical protein
MKKGNIVHLIMYQNQHRANPTETEADIKDELRTAIQNLIYRLRELGPIKSN